MDEVLQRAVDAFQKEFRSRSFSGRHQELGKMLNCLVCDQRHREPRCKQNFVEGFGPVNPKFRHGLGTKWRINPHFSKHRLQLVQATRELLPYFETANKARSKAVNLLRATWAEESRIPQNIQKESRRINRG